MVQQSPRERSLLDRLIGLIPGYGGYIARADRRASDKLLRDAVADRLRVVHSSLDEAIRAAVDRGALDQITPLERSRQRLDRIADRIRAAGSGTDKFWQTPLDDSKADTLHGYDLRLYERADNLAKLIGDPATLANLDAELDLLDQALDQRALLLQGLS
jgi:hypothetical protein